MSIVTEPLFLLSFAAVLAAMLAPVLIVSRTNFFYAVLYDGLFEVASEADGEEAPEKSEVAGGEVRVVAVEIRNSSGLNIERSHYDRQITVGFGEGAKILDAEVIEEEPSALGVTLRGVPDHDPEKVALGPILFNDGNMVLVEAVVAGSTLGKVEVDGRMVGIDGIAEQRRSTVEKSVLILANGIPALAVVSLGSLYLVAFSFLEIDFLDPLVLNPVAGGLTGLIVGDVLLLVGMYRRWRRTNKVRGRILARRVAAENGAE